MGETRWLRWIGPGVVALVAVGAIASTASGAGVRPWVPRDCPGSAADLAAGASTAAASTSAGRGAPWFRIDPDVGDDGVLRGQRLAVGLVGVPPTRTLALPPESFAAGPFGRLLLVGSDDGVRSRLQALDAARGCSWSIAESADVIRRATMDPSGTVLYEMRVARAGRADLGIWRRDVDGTTAARRVLGPPDPDPRFGRTFSTEFAWDAAGSRLAVQSCGELACRTRLLDAAGAPAASVEDPGLGGLIGLDGDRLVTYAACHGLPCPIVAIDVRSGIRRVVLPDGGPAVLVTTPAGPRLIDEAVAGGERRLRSTGLGSWDVTDLGAIPSGLGLLPTPDRAASATRVPAGWIVLSADGRLQADPSVARPLLRRLSDGLTVPIDEALR